MLQYYPCDIIMPLLCYPCNVILVTLTLCHCYVIIILIIAIVIFARRRSPGGPAHLFNKFNYLLLIVVLIHKTKFEEITWGSGTPINK